MFQGFIIQVHNPETTLHDVQFEFQGFQSVC